MMKKILYKSRLIIIAMVIFVSLSYEIVLPVSADSYSYTLYSEAIPSPDAYEWDKNINYSKLGLDSSGTVNDLYYNNERLYIAMTGRILVMDEDFQILLNITSYNNGTEEVSISSPTCVFSPDNGEIYICEESRGLIIHLDSDGEFIRELGDPGITGLDVAYAPSKLVVDEADRLYVKAKSVYEGIVELTPEGEFNRFVGANEVNPSLIERLIRMISTDEQIARMDLWLPTDYSDIAMDKDGFLLATVKDSTVLNNIVRLNSSGSDIMPEYDMIPGPVADGTVDTNLTTIAAAEDGRFAVLDSNTSRIYVYSQEGILAYTLAGSGKNEGYLTSPVDITFMSDLILVADSVTKTIEVYKPTEYGSLINDGLKYLADYDYENAAYYWQQVYDINPNNILACLGLGKYELRQGNYDTALEYFKATGERSLYSQAYKKIRTEYLEENMTGIGLIVIAIIVFLAILRRIMRKLKERGVFENHKIFVMLGRMKYEAVTWPKYMMSKPFRAFDDVKYENAGSTGFCVLILILYSWMALIIYKYQGFILNYNDVDHVNVLMIMVSSGIPYLIFTAANWAVGTLIEGKGNLAQIFKVNMYALYPGIFLNLFGVLLSRVVTNDEYAFAAVIFFIPYILYVLYTFIGLVMVHQYSFTKTVGSILLSIVFMVIIIFVLLLLATLISSCVNDVLTLIDELALLL